MLVRLFLTSFALLLMLPLSPLTARALSFNARVLVNSVVLSWESVDGAQWYDIYNGEAFVVRLPSTENTYTVEHLAQDSGFRFVLGARDGDNNTLDAEAVSVTTGNYSGLYRWENQTDDDNGGMMSEIVYRAELKEDPTYGQYMQVSFVQDGEEHVIFPLQDFSSESWDWIDYDSDSPAGIAYRLNCSKFNVLPISPSRFKVDSVRMTNDTISVDIRSSALGIGVTTTSNYVFGCDAEGPYLSFSTTGGGLAKSALFKNPMDPDNPYTYMLRRIS